MLPCVNLAFPRTLNYETSERLRLNSSLPHPLHITNGVAEAIAQSAMVQKSLFYNGLAILRVAD